MEHILRNGQIVRIQPAREADAMALVAYMNSIGGESDNLTFGAGECRYTVEAERQFIRTLAHHPGSVMLVGWVNGEIVASGSVTRDTRVRTAHNAAIGVSVRKAYWRQGIGEALMRALIGHARDSGVLRVIHLTVSEDNAGGIALYEKLGFERVGMHRGYMQVHGQYKNALLMDLHLS